MGAGWVDGQSPPDLILGERGIQMPEDALQVHGDRAHGQEFPELPVATDHLARTHANVTTSGPCSQPASRCKDPGHIFTTFKC